MSLAAPSSPMARSDETNYNSGRSLTAVAISKTKDSQQTVKWAVDHLLINTRTIVLIHVRAPLDPVSHDSVEATPELRKESEAETMQLFVPFREFGASRALQLKEVVLEDFDVPKAIINYVTANNIENIVVTASSTSRNLLTRKFKNYDTAAYLTKNAPEFCGVYVVCKGKLVKTRATKVPAHMNAFPMRSIFPGSPPKQAKHLVGSVRNSERNPDYSRTPLRNRPLLLSTANLKSNNSFTDISGSYFRSTNDLDFRESINFQSMDFDNKLELGHPESPISSLTRSPKDTDAEMRRLRLELKQMAEMYKAAHKEAIMAKEKAEERTRKIEELEQAEEAALVLVAREKEKSKVALEAAEAAQKIAEIEVKRRKNAEVKAKREAKERKKIMESTPEFRYRKYTINDIEDATNFFSEELKIGEGGYGPVLRAVIDHTSVAIKVLRPDLTQGQKQFLQEVEILSSIRHPNLVLLLGACPDYGCLVYEYMDFGSLEDRLRRHGNTPPIPWTTRFKIAAEIATALLFLHQNKPEPLVHRDLKPANILLDHNYVSKISDVGLARLVPPSVADSVTRYRMTTTAGTLYYIDPEYQKTGMLGVKSDIYSLGVLLLQIITAKSPMGLTHHVEQAIEKGTFAEMLDPTISDWPVEEALGYAKLALKCAELRRKDRPDLGKVILPALKRLRSIGEAYEATRTNYNSNHDRSLELHIR